MLNTEFCVPNIQYHIPGIPTGTTYMEYCFNKSDFKCVHIKRRLFQKNKEKKPKTQNKKKHAPQAKEEAPGSFVGFKG